MIECTQADKALAFEWLRTLAMGTLPDARLAAILLQELAAQEPAAARYRQMERNWYVTVDLIRKAMTGGGKNMRQLSDEISAAIDVARTC